ncbi:hypothetical protein DM860_008559 [Cuscuta australis]|uniref:WRKY domain-containing protein n=1 Tax=Cuscuta australis TaxID=267555 RepID=A0A328D979_9ASTE|nr:hypothetical protein DM860_008559 [Cuscuta australis]
MGEIANRAPAAIAARSRPTLTVVPRAPLDSLFSDGFVPGFSPGPMTLVSSFFAADSDACSFSQLLAGAMASPLALAANSSEKAVSVPGCENLPPRYKQNRPVSVAAAAALSPLLVVPPGLSPSGFLQSPGFLSPLQSPFGMSHQQALAHVTAQAALNQSQRQQMQAEYSPSSPPDALGHESLSVSLPTESFQTQHDDVSFDQESLKNEPSEVVSQSPQRGHLPPPPRVMERPAKDGYNWRKYGQKYVKGSECPRSYYRCSQLKCPVKKKVERSVDGHISEITYRGQHNHEPPNPSKRNTDECDVEGSDYNAQAKPQSASSHCLTHVSGSNEIEFSESDWLSDKLPYELVDGLEESVIVFEEEDEHIPKRRRTEVEAASSAPPSSHKTVTEPRIIVQTRSEVDLLDDGYKWRKYGQKVVKGNTHPRSYYRCTSSGCSVRKHVERAPADPKAVITAYEGKHNHDLPSAGKKTRSQSKAEM